MSSDNSSYNPMVVAEMVIPIEAGFLPIENNNHNSHNNNHINWRKTDFKRYKSWEFFNGGVFAVVWCSEIFIAFVLMIANYKNLDENDGKNVLFYFWVFFLSVVKVRFIRYKTLTEFDYTFLNEENEHVNSKNSENNETLFKKKLVDYAVVNVFCSVIAAAIPTSFYCLLPLSGAGINCFLQVLLFTHWLYCIFTILNVFLYRQTILY